MMITLIVTLSNQLRKIVRSWESFVDSIAHGLNVILMQFLLSGLFRSKYLKDVAENWLKIASSGPEQTKSGGVK